MSASSITRLASKILSRSENFLTLAELQQGAATVQARLATGGVDANKRVHCPDGRCSFSGGHSPPGAGVSGRARGDATSTPAAPSASSFSLASLLPRGGKCTPLAFALLAGDLALVDLLLSHGADPNKLSGLPHRFDFAPIHIAAALGSGAAVAKLLAAGADANTRLEKCRGLAPKQETPLTGANLRSTAVGDTALHLAIDCPASAAASCDVVKALLAHPGTNPNTRNHAGLTPLTVACRRKRVDVVEMLLAAGTSRAAPSSHGGGAAGDSPHASGHPRVDVNASGPLFAAIAADDEGLVRRLLAAGANVRHVRNEEGLSPLAYAVYRGCPSFANRAEVVAALLAAGAPVEAGMAQHATDLPRVREALLAAAAAAAAAAATARAGGGQGGSTSTSGSGSAVGSGSGSGSLGSSSARILNTASSIGAASSGSAGLLSHRSSGGSASGSGLGGTAVDPSSGVGSATQPPPQGALGSPRATNTAGAAAAPPSGTPPPPPRGRFSFFSALSQGLGCSASSRGPGGSCYLPPPPFSASSSILRMARRHLLASLLLLPLLLPVLALALLTDALMPVAAAACGFLRIALPIMALLCVLVVYGIVHVVLGLAAPLLTSLAAAASAAAAAGKGPAAAPLPAGFAADLAAGAGAGVAVLGAAEAGIEALGAAGSAGVAAAASGSLAVVGALEQGVEAAASAVVNNLSNYIAAATAPAAASVSAGASLSGLGAVAAAASKAGSGALSAAMAALLPCGLASAGGGGGGGVLGLWRWQGPLGLLAGLAAWFLGVVAAHALLGLAEEALVGYRPPGDRLRAFLQTRAAARHAGGAAITDDQLAAHARLCLPLALVLGAGSGVRLMPLTVLMVVMCLPTVALGVRKEFERGAWQQQQQQAAGEVVGGDGARVAASNAASAAAAGAVASK
ncbi:hypothetical protein HYH02_013537 [Chlamydomonas schloesseri]|uniref:Uncharacterized protein n=1 Tax=Chlamydomonas schloesseri TaxID=2026947 RepID=A0A835VYX8_9CHLO|nr:hypothetical protein HYH02_013537 [Chlamydomonas schloesseri]|eukprot:KAG2431008.1 hypothetical protein HYH02_013537 [Chlamydomonas schloesseri]